MALQLVKLTVLIGAGGILTSVLTKEGSSSIGTGMFSGAYKLWKRLQPEPSPSNSKPKHDSLIAQVDTLRKELELMMNNGPVTIINGKSGSSSYRVPVLVVIVVGYGCIWWKGWKLSDMMFATRRGLSDACSSVAKQLDQVTSSISAAKRHLSSRIDRVDANIDECADLISGTRDEVSQLRGDMRVFSVDVESVHRAVQTLETKIGRIEEKQDITTHGVRVLCDFVHTLENSRTAASIQASPSSSSRPAFERPRITHTSRTNSLPPKVLSLEQPSPSSTNESPKVMRTLQSTVSASGLKELEGISETTMAVTSSEVPNGDSLTDDPKSNGSSRSSRFGWKLPSLNASFLSRTNSATLSFK